MNSYAVLTASGCDRVGLVDDLSAALFDRGCNIEESRMALLGGEFAIIVLVSGDDATIESLVGDAGAVGSALGMDVSARRTEPRRLTEGLPYRVESVSFDTPGIVHAITGLLRRRGVNIDDLETETTGAPFTGAPMFRMRATVVIPPGLPVRDLRADLAEVAAEHDLDIMIRPVLPGADE